MSTTIDTVLFDADGVIQKVSPGWRETLARFCGDSDRVGEFLSDVFAAEGPCLTGHHDFADALSQVLIDWNSDAPVAEVMKIWSAIDVDQAMLALVKQLRTNGLQVGLASNQHAQRAAYMTNELGYAQVFEHLFYSCELGLAKPDQAYFTEILKRLDVDGGRVLFIDDRAENVAAAAAVGLHAEQFEMSTGVSTMCTLLQSYNLSAFLGDRI